MGAASTAMSVIGVLSLALAAGHPVDRAAAAEPPPDARPADPIAALAARLDLERYKQTIKGLTRFGDRREGTDRNRAAVDWIEAQLKSGNCTNTERLRYTYSPGDKPRPSGPPRGSGPDAAPGGGRYRGLRAPTGVNTDPLRQPDPVLRALDSQPSAPGPREEVYCTKIGTTHPEEMYIVGAHMDGIGWGEAANDDGSGAALVLEIARVLSSPDVKTERSIRFILWNNEETGLNGSYAYVAQRAALQGVESPPGSGLYPEPRWLGMVQHDMVMFDHGMPRADGTVGPAQRPEADINIEFQSQARQAGGAQELAWAFYAANEAYAADYPAAIGPHMTNTDSTPFMDLIPAISVRENERGTQIGAGSDPHWHQPTDLYATFNDDDFRLGLNAAQTTLGAVARLAGATLAVGMPAPGTRGASVEERLAAQNALFEEEYEADLKSHPERATAYGDYRYNDRLDERSLAALAAEHARDAEFVARLKAIPTEAFPEQDSMSHEVMLRTLQQNLDNYAFKEFEMPVSQMQGPHVGLADLPLSVPLDSVKHYEDYIARLHQIPRVFAQTEEVLRAGMKDHLMPVRFLLEKVPAQCRGIVQADPFLRPLGRFPADISPEDRQRLSRAVEDAVAHEVLPAYQSFADFVATEYAPQGRTTLSVTALPGGARRYLNDIRSRTSVGKLTPSQIHRIGLTEMQRIQAEMLVIAQQEGFADVQSFRASVQKNPVYIPTSAEQILDEFRRYIAQMQPRLPELFGFIPGSPVTVEAIPDFQSAMATHYQTGTPDGKRPGRVSVATSRFAERSLIDDEAIAYHEGIPGHHMQQSVAQQLTGLPKFRQHVFNSGYIEGWALYAEQLGKDVGFYQDPVSDYGRLSSELFRAVRLVVDTGIHSEGWSRDQVVEFMRKSGAIDEPTIQSETDRYIAWPAQALSYKLGQLKFVELRERARHKLGPAFDIRAFHDEMLNGGVLPLDLLDARTDQWISEERRK